MSPRNPSTSDLVILVTADEQMQAVPIDDRAVADDIGANPIDTVTARPTWCSGSIPPPDQRSTRWQR
jgi:hypothetical protein